MIGCDFAKVPNLHQGPVRLICGNASLHQLVSPVVCPVSGSQVGPIVSTCLLVHEDFCKYITIKTSIKKEVERIQA